MHIKTHMLSRGHHHTIDKIAIGNGVLSGLALYPQVVKTLMTKDVSGISMTSFAIIATNSLVWMLYARHRSLFSLGVASLLNACAALAMIGAIVWW